MTQHVKPHPPPRREMHPAEFFMNTTYSHQTTPCGNTSPLASLRTTRACDNMHAGCSIIGCNDPPQYIRPSIQMYPTESVLRDPLHVAESGWPSIMQTTCLITDGVAQTSIYVHTCLHRQIKYTQEYIITHACTRLHAPAYMYIFTQIHART